MVRVPKSFVTETLWPEFEDLNRTLHTYLDEVTDRVIREEVHKDTSEPEIRSEPRSIAAATIVSEEGEGAIPGVRGRKGNEAS